GERRTPLVPTPLARRLLWCAPWFIPDSRRRAVCCSRRYCGMLRRWLASCQSYARRLTPRVMTPAVLATATKGRVGSFSRCLATTPLTRLVILQALMTRVLLACCANNRGTFLFIRTAATYPAI